MRSLHRCWLARNIQDIWWWWWWRWWWWWWGWWWWWCCCWCWWCFWTRPSNIWDRFTTASWHVTSRTFDGDGGDGDDGDDDDGGGEDDDIVADDDGVSGPGLSAETEFEQRTFARKDIKNFISNPVWVFGPGIAILPVLDITWALSQNL